MNDLEKAREEINAADEAIAREFSARMEAVGAVAAYKKEHGLPIFNAAREEEVIARNAARVDEEIRPYYVRFLRDVMAISKEYQRYLLSGARVAFAGEAGAFADVAAQKIAPDAARIPYPDFESAYRAVEAGEAESACLPVENSYEGDVGAVMDLAYTGSLSVSGVYDLAVEQHLLARPGAALSEITHVYSHPQALAQCAPFLKAHGFIPVPAPSTSAAAKAVAESGDPKIAALAGKQAAETYGLSILASAVNAAANNTTRFAVFTAAAPVPRKEDDRFLLFFTVKNLAGALGEALAVIGRHGYNLRSLKSRPLKGLVWQYYFTACGEGSLATEAGEEMLRDLGAVCESVRVVGSYTAALL